MNTKLDKRQELIGKIKKMSNQDFKNITIFISGMEAERLLKEKEEKELQRK